MHSKKDASGGDREPERRQVPHLKVAAALRVAGVAALGAILFWLLFSLVNMLPLSVQASLCPQNVCLPILEPGGSGGLHFAPAGKTQ